MYGVPISQEYDTRGCHVVIDAHSSSTAVTIKVTNMKTGCGSITTYMLGINSINGYDDNDMQGIHNELNKLLDKFGDDICTRTIFTNQILS